MTKINKHKQSVAKTNVTMRLDNGEKLSLWALKFSQKFPSTLTVLCVVTLNKGVTILCEKECEILCEFFGACSRFN